MITAFFFATEITESSEKNSKSLRALWLEILCALILHSANPDNRP